MADRAHSTSRRALLAGLSVTALISASAAAECGTDAPLLDLYKRWKAADAAYLAAAERESDLEGLGVPDFPEAIYLRDEDRALGLAGYAFASQGGRAAYPPESASSARRGWRRRHWRWEETPITADGSEVVARRVDWPEAQQRADEIAAAWDGWHAAKAAAQQASGYAAADELTRRLGKAVLEIEKSLEATSPVSLAGLAAKAEYARITIERGDDCDAFAGMLAGDILAVAGQGIA